MPARSKAWVCGRWPSGIAVSNPAWGMDFCLLGVLCIVFASGRSRVQRSPTECGVSLGDLETSTPLEGLGQLELSIHVKQSKSWFEKLRQH